MIANRAIFDGETHKSAVHVTVELVCQACKPKGVQAAEEGRVARPQSGALSKRLLQHRHVAMVQVVLGEGVAVLAGVLILDNIVVIGAVAAAYRRGRGHGQKDGGVHHRGGRIES